MNDKVKDLDGGIFVQDKDKRGWTKHFPLPLYKTEDEEPKKETLWGKDNPFLKARLQPTQMNLAAGIDNPIYTITEKLYVSLVDKEDEAIIQAITEYAKEQGFTELVLIDKEFIREAIEKRIPKEIEVWNGQCSCPNCLYLFGPDARRKDLIRLKIRFCQNCGQALDWGNKG